MKQIHITRDSSGKVTFEEVSIDVTENVFFTNLDPKEAHWPTLSTNQLGPAPSPNSSQCTVPQQDAPYQVKYGCKVDGHQNEQGIINVFAQLAATSNEDQDPPPPPITLSPATKGQPITRQQVVEGGMSRYTITGQLFQVTDNQGNVIQSGSGIGPGLQLNPDQTGNTGIWVTGTPTVSGTYNFTFTVDDAMGGNLQQAQYSMKVV